MIPHGGAQTLPWTRYKDHDYECVLSPSRVKATGKPVFGRKFTQLRVGVGTGVFFFLVGTIGVRERV